MNSGIPSDSMGIRLYETGDKKINYDLFKSPRGKFEKFSSQRIGSKINDLISANVKTHFPRLSD